MAEYPINKGIGRPVEFKGLKAQYLFIFCGGLLALFVLFVILYMVGIDQWICIGFGAASSSLLVWPVSYTHLRNLIQKDSDPQLVKFVNSIDSVPEVETA